MSTRQVSDRNDPVIEHVSQLAAPMAAGEKSRERWRIGTEHEKLVYCVQDRHAPSYEEPGGIRDLPTALGLLDAGASRLGMSASVAVLQQLRDSAGPDARGASPSAGAAPAGGGY